MSTTQLSFAQAEAEARATKPCWRTDLHRRRSLSRSFLAQRTLREIEDAFAGGQLEHWELGTYKLAWQGMRMQNPTRRQRLATRWFNKPHGYWAAMLIGGC